MIILGCDINNMTRILISLGSNKGDRRGFINAAIQSLNAHPNIKVIYTSRFRNYPAWGPAIATFLNGTAIVKTSLSPLDFLRYIQEIEKKLSGRERPYKWGPRTIDIDILLIEDYIIEHPDLRVPHPYMLERLFVLEPAAEIAPHWIHPQKKKTIKHLYHLLLRKLQTL